MPLTVNQVKNAKPGRHSDGRGLYLLVKPSGSRSWVLRVQARMNGEPQSRRYDWGIGSVAFEPIASDLPLHLRSTLTLSEAREKSRIGRELAKAGIIPSQYWKRSEVQAIPSFEQAATRYHTEVEGGWKNGKHRTEWLGSLKRYAFADLGSLPVNAIDAPAMQKVLLPIWLEKPETARRVKQRLGTVLDYSHAQGWRDSEAPMRALNRLLGGIKQPKGSNFAAMPYGELPDFLGRLRKADWSMGRLALQFLILTAARSGEVRGATWAEIDFDKAEWRIAGKRMKAGKPHIVPLVPAALDILKSLTGLFPHEADDIVFPGNRGKPMSDATMAKAMRETPGGEGLTVHGFRSTFRDWAADKGYADAWAEAALAHGNPDKTEAAYRRTTYFDQRRDRLMPAWAAFALGDKSNVIALADRRA